LAAVAAAVLVGPAFAELASSGGAVAAAPRVSLEIPAGSQVVTSSVVHGNGSSWFAVAVGLELRIYRLQGGTWVVDGVADMPAGFPPPGEFGGTLGSTSITGTDAPDFTVLAYGADTAWFAIAARTGGSWHTVPFDDQYASRHDFTFAYGAEHNLIHGAFNACGCAPGPTTDQWYRFAGGVFVATGPPGEAAVCSAKALTAANHWPVLPDDPLVRDVGVAIDPVRFACADGWAVAVDGPDVALYEQHGPNVNSQSGHDWLRVGFGTPHLVGTTIEYAMPRSLLDKLGAAIGVRFPRAKPEPTPKAPPTAPWQRAPIPLSLGPGDTVSETNMYGGRPSVLTVTVRSHGSGSGSEVTHFRWRSGRWVTTR
jgi:hypothetical protein